MKIESLGYVLTYDDGTVILRCSRKRHVCDGGHDGERRVSCAKPINPGDHYIEYVGESPLYSSGHHYHLECAEQQGLLRRPGRRCDCENSSCKEYHTAGGCLRTGEVPAMYGVLCRRCAVYMPAVYLKRCPDCGGFNCDCGRVREPEPPLWVELGEA